MNKNDKIYIAGHRGLAGSAILKQLKELGYNNLLYKTHKELDLLKQNDTFDFIAKEKPDYIFIAAAKVGGILANNTYPADFIYQNLSIQNNIIYSAYKNNVKKLLFLGSSCIYPKECPQPMKEEHLLSGKLEPTNEPYALAKIAGIKLCQSFNRQFRTNFIAAMPTNMYGINDNFNLETSHVIPALLRKFHDAKISGAKKISLWGTGKPLREFLHSDDFASACIFLMNNFDPSASDNEKGSIFVNVGTGAELSIKELALKIKSIVGFEGEVLWDSSKPDGTMRKLLGLSKLKKLGWNAGINIDTGLKEVYNSYKRSL